MTTNRYPLLALLGLATGAVTTIAQTDWNAVEIKATHVAGNVHMLEGQGGNIAVSAGSDGLLIVDDQFLPLAGKIEAALARINDGTLKYVLNTHYHGDHSGGNSHFGANATIVAQTNVRGRLAADARTPAAALPVITFDHDATVHFNGEAIQLVHTSPGHTDGDSVVQFTGSNVFHMGDLFNHPRFPFVDLNSGGSVDGYIAAVGAALTRIPLDAKIIPGHGPLATRDELAAYHQAIVDTVKLVRAKIAKGSNIGDILRSGVLDPWAERGEGWITTERWVQTIFNDSKR